MTVAKRNPYMKWYARDWRGDGAVRLCSFAARGLWADLLSLMHDEGEPYGHLLINNLQPSNADLGRMLGASPKEIQKLLTELERAGVFSRRADGTIFSRRMVRDKEKSDTDKENGKGGGNPLLTGKDKHGVNPPDKAQSQKPLPEPLPEAAADERERDTAEFKELARILGFDANNHENWLTFIALKTQHGLSFEAHIKPAAQHHASSGKLGKTLAYIRPKAIELRDQAAVKASAPVVFEDCDDMEWAGRIRHWELHPELEESGHRWPAKWGPIWTEPNTRCPREVIERHKARAVLPEFLDLRKTA